MKRENNTDKKRKSAPRHIFSRFLRNLTRQIIAAAIFFAVIFAMHSSNNVSLSNYANSLGNALRYDSHFEQSIKAGAKWLRERFSQNDYPDTEGISFR